MSTLIFTLFLSFISALKGGLDCELAEDASLLNLPDGCTKIYGDLIWDRDYDVDDLHKKLGMVEEVYGRIYLANVSYVDLSFFGSLRSVFYRPLVLKEDVNVKDNTVAAFAIQLLPNLKRLAMPNLTSVVVDVLYYQKQALSLFVYGTPELCLTEEENERYHRLDRFLFFQKAGLQICEQNPKKKYCRTINVMFYVEELPLGCQVLDASLEQPYEPRNMTSDHVNQVFSTIEEIYGHLMFAWQDYLESLELPSLRLIYYDRRGLYTEASQSLFGKLLSAKKLLVYLGFNDMVISISNNAIMRTISMPQLQRVHNFGNFVYLNNNSMLEYSPANCRLFKSQAFTITDRGFSACGEWFALSDDVTWLSLSLQLAEHALCTVLNCVAYAALFWKIHQTHSELSYFQYSAILLVVITTGEVIYTCICEVTYNHDNFIRSTLYTNRLATLLSMIIYRTVAFTSLHDVRIVLFLTFIVIGVCNTRNLQEAFPNFQLQPFHFQKLNHVTLAAAVLSLAFVRWRARTANGFRETAVSHHHRLSIAFLLQAAWAFVCCGFQREDFGLEWTPRVYFWFERITFWCGRAFIRWHYLIYAVFFRMFLEQLLQDFATSPPKSVNSSSTQKPNTSAISLTSIKTANKWLECELSTNQSLLTLPDDCDVVNGDLVWYDDYDLDILHKKLGKVEEVNGRVLMTNTSYTDLSFFGSLRSVYYRPLVVKGTVAAFAIQKLQRLQRLSMPNLVSVVIDVLYYDMTFLIYDSPNLCLTEAENDRFHTFDRFLLHSTTGLSICEPKPRRRYCSSKVRQFTLGDLPMGCQVLSTGLSISDDNFSEEEANRLLESIEDIYGDLTISTSYTRISLPNLKLLYNDYNQFYIDTSELKSREELPRDVLLLGSERIFALSLTVTCNPTLTSLNLPTQLRWHYFGDVSPVSMDGNPVLQYTPEMCRRFKTLFTFIIHDPGFDVCGLAPEFSDALSWQSLALQIGEQVLCPILNLVLYAGFFWRVHSRKSKLSYFQLAIIVLAVITMIEVVVVCALDVTIFDDGYPKYFEIFTLFFGQPANDFIFLNVVNVLYANRMTALLSASLYRTIVFVSMVQNKLAVFVVFVVVGVCSIANIKVMMTSDFILMYNFQSLNYVTTVLVSMSAALLRWRIRTVNGFRQEIVVQQNSLSWALVAQAFWAFVCCGFYKTQFPLESHPLIGFWVERLSFRFGNAFYRWHYLIYAVVFRLFAEDLLRSFSTGKPAAITAGSRTTSSASIVSVTAVKVVHAHQKCAKCGK